MRPPVRSVLGAVVQPQLEQKCTRIRRGSINRVGWKHSGPTQPDPTQHIKQKGINSTAQHSGAGRGHTQQHSKNKQMRISAPPAPAQLNPPHSTKSFRPTYLMAPSSGAKFSLNMKLRCTGPGIPLPITPNALATARSMLDSKAAALTSSVGHWMSNDSLEREPSKYTC